MIKRFILFFAITFVIFAEGEQLNLESQTTKLELDYNMEFVNALKEPSKERLINQTKSIAILSLATMGILYALPEDFTGWERDDFKYIGLNYKENFEERGVIWDPDNAFFNFVGHPYVGAVYYIAARKSGYDEYHSFLYSFVMSSFFWEMGIEAFAEAPSIQDIIITPGAGAILGELMFAMEHKILENDGKILKSRFLGKTALIAIDPIGSLANTIGYKDDQVMGYWSFGKNSGNRMQLAYNLRIEF